MFFSSNSTRSRKLSTGSNFRIIASRAVSFLERVELLEKNIYATKKVFTFSEACMYIGVSESMLYKLTANKEIPHYKPRGKMIYFAKEELDEWLLQNHELAVDDATRMAHEAAAVQPFLNEKRHGKRKKN